MKIEVDNGIVLKEVFSGIKLETEHGEFIAICMRDSGFEFNYMDTWYEAKNGIVNKLRKDKPILKRKNKDGSISWPDETV